VTILLFEPDSDSGKSDETHEVDEQLVVSGGDTAELFELVEEALDDVALLVEIDVVGTLDLAVSFRRDDDLCAGLGHPVDEMVGIIALVGDGRARDEAVDKIMRKGDVIALPRSPDQADRIAQRIAGSVDFGAQPAARPAQALGIRPPFALRAPAAC
jgi:hypothetical protein